MQKNFSEQSITLRERYTKEHRRLPTGTGVGFLKDLVKHRWYRLFTNGIHYFHYIWRTEVMWQHYLMLITIYNNSFRWSI